MLLNAFLERFEEEKAHRQVRDFLSSQGDGSARAEFLGHFLDSAFQPIVEITTGQPRTIGFEAFIRPVAGHSGIDPRSYFQSLNSDDQEFVDRLCRELHVSNFLRMAQASEFISINISPSALEEHIGHFDGLTQQIAQLNRTGLHTNRLCLELDLSPELDAGVVYTFASQLRRLGVLISMENFDADCASFSRLIHSRPEVVKFNRTWLEADLADPAYLDLVTHIVTAVRALGAKAHLERVETEREYLFAIACQFDRAQGYYIAAPDKTMRRVESEGFQPPELAQQNKT